MLVTALSRRSAAGYSLAHPPALGLAMAAGGTNGTYAMDTRNLAKFSNDALTTGVSLSSPRELHTTVGNTTKAISAGGSYNGYYTSTESYIYSTNALGAGSTLTFAADRQVGFGNSSVGYLTNTGYTYLGATDKYAYSNDTISTTTGLTSDHYWGFGFGNTSAGYAASTADNYGRATVEKYSYAGDVVTDTVSLTPSLAGTGGGCSNGSTGLFIGGQTTAGALVADITSYSMTDGTQTTATSVLPWGVQYNTAACNGTIAYSFGGSNGNAIANVFKYNFSTKAVTQAGALYNDYPVPHMSATSDSHGGLS